MTAKMTDAYDFALYSDGLAPTLYRLAARSDEAKQWVTEHVSKEGYQPAYPDFIYIEHGYIGDLLSGIIDAGFTLERV